MNKKYLILENKENREIFLYKLIGEEYVEYLDNSKIANIEGFELLLNGQFNIYDLEINDDDLKWFLDYLNPDNYEKVTPKHNKNYLNLINNGILYVKNGKSYMFKNLNTNEWVFNWETIFSKSDEFDQYYSNKILTVEYKLFKYILVKIYKEDIKQILIGNLN